MYLTRLKITITHIYEFLNRRPIDTAHARLRTKHELLPFMCYTNTHVNHIDLTS